MSEEKDNVFKIDVPIFTNEELRELDCIIENDMDNIINIISKKITKDREIIFFQKIIYKLQKDNYKLDRENQHFFDRIQDLQKQLDQLKEVDRQICNEELITKDKYQSILEYNAKLESEVKKWQQ